ncbi:MAG: hypothetical protein MUF22_03295 [Chitinispirillaceae bacterium]|jgi:hypothetical protein|nr:hypothetical protein [Chitinispirillaceae bacterium]
MNKYLLSVITALVSAGVVFLVMHRQEERLAQTRAEGDLGAVGASVEKRYHEISSDIAGRLAAFGSEVASDQLFSLRVLAEGNPSAPEVTAKAVQFLDPMGFQLLEIVDSSNVILSSGHFPASAGSSDSQKVAMLKKEPVILADAIMGQSVVALQSAVKFEIADVPFAVLGGVIIDDGFLQKLSPCPGIRVLFRQGSAVIGMPGLKSISDISNRKIIINNRGYSAVKIDLPVVDGGEPACLVAVVETTGK